MERKERDLHHTNPVPENKTESESSKPVTPEELVEGWNDYCVPLGLPKVTELSQARRKKALDRIREHSDLRWWGEVLGKIARSRVLKGQCRPADGYDKPFKADFDWLLECDNALKTYEGKYDG